MQTAELIRALSRPEAYPVPPRSRIEVVQTHISMLLFTHDRVYKIKKPIKLDFLDYSTLERRRHFCAEEVRLNRRLAPDVYLGVVPIVRETDGSVRINGSGETIEYAVEMVRLPPDRMMSALLNRGEIDNKILNEIAQILMRFHQEAATGDGVDEYGRPQEIAEQAEDNLRGIEPYFGDLRDNSTAISRVLFDRLRAAARAWLAENEELLKHRVRDGRIREGHGDLHTGNICMTEAGVVIYDCIEFSRRFRCRDVAGELAFLAMDLDLRCFRGFAAFLLRRYADLTDDPALLRVAAFYKLHFALVRGKVACIRARDPNLDAAEQERSCLEAMRYFHLAVAYTLPPALILMCGLPASGKSFAASAIAKPFEAVVLRSDVVRKELMGVSSTTRCSAAPDAGIYSPQFTQRTYAALLDRAMAHVEQGRTVVVDATFPTSELRTPFVEAARQAEMPCVLVEVTCAESIIRERLRERADDSQEVSDADWQVYQSAKERFQPPDEIPPANRVGLESGGAAELIVAQVFERLVQLVGVGRIAV